jgi:catechol 2,3-dioxygenase-like lactoylglutathione lyase family enzyme
MIGYATFGVRDMAASKPFFEAVLAPLGYKKFYDDSWVGFGIDGDPNSAGTIWLGAPYDGNEACPSNGAMIGFAAPSRTAVDDFHAAALANGGTCEGPPGLREAYGPDFYVAYVRDPVGNKMSAVYRGV